MSDRLYGVVSRETPTEKAGLSFLRDLAAGKHPAPPFSEAAGILLTEVEEGRVLFTGTTGSRFLNPLGTIHGGWISMILDSAMACAVHSTLKPGQGYTSAEMKVNFVRPLLPDTGELTCEGTVIHRGGTLATSEGKLRDAAGKLIAHGTETCLIFDAKNGR